MNCYFFATVTVAEAELFRLFGSAVIAVAVAVLVSFEPAGAVTVTFIVTVALLPLARLPRLQVNVPLVSPGFSPEQLP